MIATKSIGRQTKQNNQKSNSKFHPAVLFVTFSEKRTKKLVLLKDWLLFVETFISFSNPFKLIVTGSNWHLPFCKVICVPPLGGWNSPSWMESLIKRFYTGSPRKAQHVTAGGCGLKPVQLVCQLKVHILHGLPQKYRVCYMVLMAPYAELRKPNAVSLKYNINSEHKNSVKWKVMELVVTTWNCNKKSQGTSSLCGWGARKGGEEGEMGGDKQRGRAHPSGQE